MLYRAYFTYYDKSGLTKHRPAHDNWVSDRNKALSFLESEHPHVDGWVPAGNTIKEKVR